MRKIVYPLFFSLIIFTMACKLDTTKDNPPVPVSTTGNPTIDALTVQIAKSPGDATLYAARAEAYYNAEGFDESIADLKKALSICTMAHRSCITHATTYRGHAGTRSPAIQAAVKVWITEQVIITCGWWSRAACRCRHCHRCCSS